MILKFISPFKLEEDHEITVMNKSTDVAVGLRIVVPISLQGDQQHSNVVVKSALRLNQPTTNNNSALDFCCFLKTCNLCNKGLRLDKEVYMYRGDQGFCSIECRDRQIFLDEMRELEASTKQMIASYRSSCSPARHETRILLEDPQQGHHNKPIPNHRRNRGVVIS